MIQESDIMPRLVGACPAYGPLLDDYLSEEADEGRSERLTYNEVGDFVRWLVQTVAAGDQKWVPPFADELERFLTDGDEETRQIAVIGCIEDIQDACVEYGVDPDLFMTAMGPIGKSKWFETLRWRFQDRWKGSIEAP
jgi:hypothetical protein